MIYFTLIMCFIAFEATVAPLIIYGCAHILMATYVYLKDTDMYISTHSLWAFARFHPGKATETLCKWVFAGRTFVGNVKREKEKEREDRKERGRILGRVEAGRISLLRLLPPRDRPRARIIFTEIKSKIRLALKCALDRARPNRRWLSKRRRCLYPGARRRLVRSGWRGCDEDARIYKRRETEEDR